jgi:enoyl-CoA hydratase/carnithine racemase|tara:strand:- start:2749 stop:3459 length:711 start_codon:yes stop_codon:yes gene_type:complete
MIEKVLLAFSDDGVATVTLNNPPLNIYDLEMRDGLIEAITAVRDHPDARVLVLQTEAKHFSAGADLSEFGSAESIFHARRIRWDRDPWLPLLALPIPTLAVLKGFAIGSGMEMAMLCDLRIAASGTIMGLPETKLGMLPAAGGTQSLTRLIGPDKASPLILTGRNIEVDEAHQLGIVNEIVSPENLQDRVNAISQRLISMNPKVVANLKRCIFASSDLPLDQGLKLESELSQSTVS